jgi:ketosteroid isomerase-like protein
MLGGFDEREVRRLSDVRSPKDLVATWLAVGPATPEGRAMVTDDFVWQGPLSMADLYGNDDASLHGPDQLAMSKALDKALFADYENAPANTNLHFMIAEGDVVVMEFDTAFTTHDGEKYHNQYCLSITVRDGKVAHLREHADTLYSERVCMGTPAKKAGVLTRLETLRAEGDL